MKYSNDLTYMWNLRKEKGKQKFKFLNAENSLVVVRQQAMSGGGGRIGDGVN